MSVCIKPSSPATVRLIVRRALKQGSNPIILTPIIKTVGKRGRKTETIVGYESEVNINSIVEPLYSDPAFSALDRTIFELSKNEKGESPFIDALLNEVNTAIDNADFNEEQLIAINESGINPDDVQITYRLATESDVFGIIDLNRKINSENVNNYLQDEGEIFKSLNEIIVDENQKDQKAQMSFENSLDWYNTVFDGAIDAYNHLKNTFTKKTLTPNIILDLENRKIIKPGQSPDSETNIFLMLDQIQTMNDLWYRLNGEYLYPEMVGIDKNNYKEQGFKEKLRKVSETWDDAMKQLEDQCLYVVRDGKKYKMAGDLLNQAARHYELGSDVLSNEYQNFLDYIKLRDFDMMVSDMSDGVVKISSNKKFDPESVYYYIPSMDSDEALLFNYDKQPDANDYISAITKYLYKTFPMYSLNGEKIENAYMNHIQVWDAISELGYIDKSNPTQGLVIAIFEFLNDRTKNNSTKAILYSFYKNVLEESSDKIDKNHGNVRSIRSINGSQDLVSAFVEQTIGVVKNKLVEIVVEDGKIVVNETHNKQSLSSDIKLQNEINKHYNEFRSMLSNIAKQFNLVGNDFTFENISSNTKLVDENKVRRSLTKPELSSLRKAYMTLIGIDIMDKSTIGISVIDALKLQNSNYEEFLINSIPRLAMLLNTISQDLNAFDQQSESSVNYDIINISTDKITGAAKVKVDMYTSSELANSPVIIFRTIAEAYKTAYGEQIKSTMINIEGNGEARYTNYNMAYGMKNNFQRMNRIINSVVGTSKSPFSRNLFAVNPGLLKNVVVRSGVKNGDKIRPNTKMNESEHFFQQFNIFFAKQLMEGKNPYFDFTNFSDKGTNYMVEIDASLFLDSNGKAKSNTEMAGMVYEQNKAYIENTLRATANKYYAIGTKLKELFGVDFKVSQTGDLETDIKAMSESILNIVTSNAFEFTNKNGVTLNLTGWDAIRQVAKMANVELIQYLDYQGKTEDNGTPKLSDKNGIIKSSLLPDKSEFEEFNKYKSFDIFMTSMQPAINQMVEQIKDMGYQDLVEASPFIESKLNSKNKAIVDANGINPALEFYFWSWNLVSSGIMNSQVGSIFEHKGKTQSDKLVTQTKRNVAFTAQMASYLTGSRYSLNSYMNVAQMADFTNDIKPIANKDQTVTCLDGGTLQYGDTWCRQKAGFGGPYAMTGGIDQKSFASSVNPNTGVFTIIKHAAFTMTPNWIKLTQNSDIDLLELHKQNYSKVSLIGIDISVSSNLRENGKAINEFDDVYYYKDYDVTSDQEVIDIYRLDKIERLSNGVYKIYEYNITRDEVVESTKAINNLYDLWQVLGGERSLEKTNDTTNYTTQNMMFKQSMNSFNELNIIQCLSDNGVSDMVIDPEYIHFKYKDAYNALTNNGELDLLLSSFLNDRDYLLSSDNTDEEIEKYNELKTYILEQYELGTLRGKEYQPIKGKAIDMISFGGAIKAGTGMINSPSTVSKQLNSEYIEQVNKKAQGLNVLSNNIQVDGFYGIDDIAVTKLAMNNTGRQLNTEHHIDHAELSIPKQMLNATAFGGKTIDYSNRLFEALASLIEHNLNDRFKELDASLQGDFESYKKSVIDSVSKSMKRQLMDSDQINVATMIVEGFEEVPLNSSFIRKDAITDIISSLTRDAMKLKFPGIMAVINPTSRIMQMRDVSGGILPIRQGTKIIYKPIVGKQALSGENFTNWAKYNAGKQGIVHTKDGDIDISKMTSDEVIAIKGRELLNPSLSIVITKNGITKEVVISDLDKDFVSPLASERATSLLAKKLKNIKSSIDSKGDLITTKDAKGNIVIMQKNKKGELESNPDADDVFNNEDFIEVFNNFVGDSDLKAYAKTHNMRLLKIKKKGSKAEKIESINLMLKLIYRSSPDGNVSMETLDAAKSISDSMLRMYKSAVQKDIDLMTDGKKPISSFAALDSYDSFELKVNPGEVVMPAIFRDKLLLEEGVNISAVDEDYYYGRLKENYDIMGKMPARFDFAFTNGTGKNIYLFTNKDEFKKIAEKGKQLTISDGGLIKNDYGKTILKVPDDITDDICLLPNGQIAILTESVTKEALSSFDESLTDEGLFKNAEFDLVLYGKNPNANSEELRNKAQMMFNTFKEYLNLTGARIPGQHFQSFQYLKIAEFIEDKDSVAFVPESVTLFSGSRR